MCCPTPAKSQLLQLFIGNCEVLANAVGRRRLMLDETLIHGGVHLFCRLTAKERKLIQVVTRWAM